MTVCGLATLDDNLAVTIAFQGKLTRQSTRLKGTPEVLIQLCLPICPPLVSPMLLSGGKPGDEESMRFVSVSTELQEESPEDRVLSQKYMIPDCGSGNYARQHCGGRDEMVGDVWVVKGYRDTVTQKSINRPKLVLQATNA